MDSLQASRICGGNTAYKRNKSDFYPTPKEATIAILEFLNIDKKNIIWEPACGEGDMINVFEKYGYNFLKSDIKDGIDFLETNLDLFPCNWIITNPPWSLAEKFIKHSFELKVPFAMLLKQHFWNAKKRYSLFKECTPKYVLPLTWRPDFCYKQRGSGSPLLDVMWCVWDGDTKYGETKYMLLERPKIDEKK